MNKKKIKKVCREFTNERYFCWRCRRLRYHKFLIQSHGYWQCKDFDICGAYSLKNDKSDKKRS